MRMSILRHVPVLARIESTISILKSRGWPYALLKSFVTTPKPKVCYLLEIASSDL